MKITKDLEGKRVKITDIDNEIFEGIVSDYIYPEDNEPEGVAEFVSKIVLNVLATG